MRPSRSSLQPAAGEQSGPQPRAAELAQRSTERKLRNFSPRREEKPPTPNREKLVSHMTEGSSLLPKPRPISSSLASFHEVSLDLQRRKTQKNEVQGCNCRRSFCLKLQCPCFSKGELCKEGCNCDQCKNLKDNMERSEAINQIIVRNPHAFSKPVEITDTSDAGCRCHNSKCIMKYCKCFSRGVPCTEKCACENCKNIAVKKSSQSRSARKPDPQLEKGKSPRKKAKFISQN